MTDWLSEWVSEWVRKTPQVEMRDFGLEFPFPEREEEEEDTFLT